MMFQRLLKTCRRLNATRAREAAVAVVARKTRPHRAISQIKPHILKGRRRQYQDSRIRYHFRRPQHREIRRSTRHMTATAILMADTRTGTTERAQAAARAAAREPARAADAELELVLVSVQVMAAVLELAMALEAVVVRTVHRRHQNRS